MPILATVQMRAKKMKRERQESAAVGSEGHLRSAEADVFRRKKICIRCSRSSITKFCVQVGASQRFKETLRHYIHDLSPSLFFSLSLCLAILSSSLDRRVANSTNKIRVYILLLMFHPGLNFFTFFFPSSRCHRNEVAFLWLTLTYEAIAFSISWTHKYTFRFQRIPQFRISLSLTINVFFKIFLVIAFKFLVDNVFFHF